MLKAIGSTTDGRPALVIGLTLDELSRLRSGESVKSDLDKLVGPTGLYLFAGRDDDALAEDLRRAGLIANAPPSDDDAAHPLTAGSETA